jgi:hypothetical protein
MAALCFVNDHVLVTPERAAFLRQRLKMLFAERQAAQEAIERIAAGAPRSKLGKFDLSFEHVVDAEPSRETRFAQSSEEARCEGLL